MATKEQTPSEPAEAWVWVRDQITGHAYPYLREAAALEPERFKADEEHPVRDGIGRLLPTKFNAGIAPAPADVKKPASAPKEA